MLLTLLLSSLGAMSAPPSPCAPDQVALDEAAARRIANRVIAAQSLAPARRYLLNVVADPDGRHWLAYQTPRANPRTRGGGGLGMRIDRCTGAVSDIIHQR